MIVGGPVGLAGRVTVAVPAQANSAVATAVARAASAAQAIVVELFKALIAVAVQRGAQASGAALAGDVFVVGVVGVLEAVAVERGGVEAVEREVEEGVEDAAGK